MPLSIGIVLVIRFATASKAPELPDGEYLIAVYSQNKTWSVRPDGSFVGDARESVEDIKANPSGMPLHDAAAITIIEAISRSDAYKATELTRRST